MACGCGGNKGIRNAGRRAVVTPRTQSLRVPPRTPRQNQVSAQSAQAANQSQGLDKEKRQREKERREAILRKLGRL